MSKSILMLVCCSFNIFLWSFTVSAFPTQNENRKYENPLLNSFGMSSDELIREEAKNNEHETLIRNKRTIGFLRQLFPGLSQIIDRKIQQLTRVIFRVVGRLILRGGGAGGGTTGGTADNGGSNGDGKGGRRISITLPTYPPFEDEEEEGNSTIAPISDNEAPSDQATARSSIASSTLLPVSSSTPAIVSSTGSVTTPGSISGNNTTEIVKISGASFDDLDNNSAFPAVDVNPNTETQDNNTIRRINRDVSEVLSDSTEALLLDEESNTTETNKKKSGLLSRLRDLRNKRNSAGLFRLGSGGGSGNFIFDLIRLVAGSGTSPEKDEEQNAPRDQRDDDIADGNDISGTSSSFNNDESYNAGIPGPLTRLFVLANRGISNVIQDLILRLAQTSERIVNFKARLITSII